MITALHAEPDYQGQGLGRNLVEKLMESAASPVLVLGDSAFYGRFGFQAEQEKTALCDTQRMGPSMAVGRLSELVGGIRSADTLAGAGLLGLGLASTQLLCRLDQGLFSGAPVDASIGNRQAIFQVSRVAEFLVAAF